MKSKVEELQTKADIFFETKKYELAKTNFGLAIEHADFSKLTIEGQNHLQHRFVACCWELINPIKDEESDLKIKYLSEALHCYKKDPDQNHDVSIQLSMVEILIARSWQYAQNEDLNAALMDLVAAKEEMALVSPSSNNFREKDYYHLLEELLERERCLAGSFADKAYADKDYKSAIEYYRDIINLLERQLKSCTGEDRLDSMHILADTSFCLAQCYMYLNERDNSIYYFTLSFSVYAHLEQSTADLQFKNERITVEKILLDYDGYYATKLREQEIQPMQSIHTESVLEESLNEEEGETESEKDETIYDSAEEITVSTTMKPFRGFFANKEQVIPVVFKPQSKEELMRLTSTQLTEIRSKLLKELAQKEEQFTVFKERKVMEFN